MRAVALVLLFALSAHAADGGGWPDGPLGSSPADVVSLVPVHAVVRQLDGGVELVDQLACMAPDTAQSLDLGLRSAENERDGLKVAVVVTSTAAAVTTVAAIVAIGVCVAKR